MPKVKVYNLEGKVVGEENLNDAIFGLKPNHGLIQQVVTAIQANSRKTLGHTKTRGEVRGGGKKPWAQKHTGRARHGSTRSPIWRHGGVTFGPRMERNWKVKINKAMKKKALFMTLSDKAMGGNLILLEKMEMPEIKTKKFIAMLSKLPVHGKKMLIVLKDSDQKIIKSARNIQKVKTIRADSLNVYDVINCQYMLAAKEVVAVIEKTFKK